MSPDRLIAGDDALWFKDAVIYQLHVRSFFDSNGDGVGDFAGLVSKLDYLSDLGINTLWLLPFYPSPLRDDGYDIADFTSINPTYGTMRDFRTLLREAHRRGLKVITELVLNHTSDQHPWFQRARAAGPSSRYGKYYVWSDTPERYTDARIIFQDFETSNWSWDPEAKAYYWHRFYSHQPDLNYENPEVRRAMIRALDFWFEMGVDGLRLDAVPYLFEREGTMCENLPETHDFLRELRTHIDTKFTSRMLLAEANQWPEDAAEYFGDGDECHMCFHFPLMPRLFMSVQMEDRFPIVDILQQTPEIPENSQWAVFLRNHDELTLEMVTDEERDFMYRVYARDRQARINLGIRRRLAPLMGNNRARIELLNGLMLSLPGTPIIYYGDEIGMGDNVYLGDRHGVRTPMQWSADRNAGFSRVNPQSLVLPPIIDPEFHYETVNVETQAANPQSFLWWMRRLIGLRKRHQVFGRGSIEFLSPDNPKVIAFVRALGDEQVLVVANLSRFAQHAELDLAQWRGLVPRELFGQTWFPPVGELPYLVTLAPHAFFWFSLEHRVGAEANGEASPPAAMIVGDRFESVFAPRAEIALGAALEGFLPSRRWFAGKARTVQGVTFRDVVRLATNDDLDPAVLGIVDVSYLEGESETYAVPMIVLTGERADRMRADNPGAVIADVQAAGEWGLLVDGLFDPRFCTALLDTVRRRRRTNGRVGVLSSQPTAAMRTVLRDTDGPLEPDLFRAEQTNTCVAYGHRLILKLFRKSEEGTNPDLEVGLHLNARGFAQAPVVAGSIEHIDAAGTTRTLAIVHEIVPNEGDAWGYTRDELGRFYDRALAEARDLPTTDEWDPSGNLVALAERDAPTEAHETTEAYLDSAELMGRRVAELHMALASDSRDASFRPESFTTLYQRSVYQSMRNLEQRNIRLLRQRLSVLTPIDRDLAATVLERHTDLTARLRTVIETPATGKRIRYHGDLHLGQVLGTGRDFVLIDFEGEPARSLADRRIKRSPLRDVAGMLRSFDYARHVALRDEVGRGLVEPGGEGYELLMQWGAQWCSWVSAAFLRAYLDTAAGASFLPDTREEVAVMLDAFVMEKAVYELGYELNTRPDWAGVPLAGILSLLGPS